MIKRLKESSRSVGSELRKILFFKIEVVFLVVKITKLGFLIILLTGLFFSGYYPRVSFKRLIGRRE